MTIKQATLKAYNDVGDTFHATTLLRNVKASIISRPFDGTILRTLRRLRREGVIDYECTDRNRSFYKKK